MLVVAGFWRISLNASLQTYPPQLLAVQMTLAVGGGLLQVLGSPTTPFTFQVTVADLMV